MALKWSFRRQLLYYSVAAVVLLILLLTTYKTFFTSAPSCFDGRQNGDEHGVDCGGSCTLLCAAEAHAPVVLWARAFRTSPQTYTAAAYIQNSNQGAGAKAVPYSLQLFDEQNLLVVEMTGSLDIPPVSTVPIVVPNINVGLRNVSRVLFAFTDDPVWEKAGALPVLRLQNQKLAADGSVLSATVYNDSNIGARNVMVEAVLFDAQGVARAASVSRIPSVARKASQDVVFTWANGVPDIIKAEITVLPPL